MNGRKRLEMMAADPSLLDPRAWVPVDEEALAPEDRDLFRRRRRAVTDYLNNVPVKEIVVNTGISRSEIYRYTKRCLQAHPDGSAQGYRGLLPRKHLSDYRRQENLLPHAKGPGMLMALFEEYPAIAKAVRREYLGKGQNRLLGAHVPFKIIHKFFLDACIDQRVPPDHYPFTYKSKGRESLRRYLASLEDEDPAAVAWARGEKDAGRHWSATGPAQGTPRFRRPFAEVQLDGHKIDLRAVVDVPGIDGLPVRLPLSRFWVLALVECASRAILGYHVCLAREYSQQDVLWTLRNALTSWQPMTLSIPRLEYQSGAGFPRA